MNVFAWKESIKLSLISLDPIQNVPPPNKPPLLISRQNPLTQLLQKKAKEGARQPPLSAKRMTQRNGGPKVQFSFPRAVIAANIRKSRTFQKYKKWLLAQAKSTLSKNSRLSVFITRILKRSLIINWSTFWTKIDS